jgi:hypothetical protein
MNFGHGDSKPGALIIVACVLAMAGASYSIFRSVTQSSDDLADQRYAVAGSVLAEETDKLLVNGGTVVVLTPPPAATGLHALNEVAAGLHDALRARRHLQIVGLEPVDPPSSTEAGHPFNFDVLQKIVRDQPALAAIISVAGAPQLTAEDLAHLPAKLPKIIVFASPPLNLKPMLEAKVVQAAVVTRFSASPMPTGKVLTPREAFDLNFQVAHPDDAATLP